MRRSVPMPRRTSPISAPSDSQRAAISLMNVIFIASIALAAYFVSSALSGVITKYGAPRRTTGSYNSRIKSAGSECRTPTMILSQCMRSCTAEPSRRNSGLLTTWRETPPMAANCRSTCALVPTGTVLLITTTVPSER